MTPELIGKISGAVVFLSGLIYMRQVVIGRSKPNIASWTVWAVIGFALWANYKESGATDNAWPAFAGMINPIIIMILGLRFGKRRRLDKTEITCLVLGGISIAIWWFLEKRGAEEALYIAIIADLWAAVPTAKDFLKHPEIDRPLMWILFAVGFGIGIFAIPEGDRSFTNYILPIYMVLMSGALSWLLVRYRLKMRHPFSEWY